ncbi:MAG: RluA family pseudouridine synthase [Amphiplicatus sp.]
MSGVHILTVADGEAGMRLDRWFKTHFPGLRHGELEKLLRTGQIRVDGGRVKANRRLESGEKIRIPPLSGKTSAETAPPALSREDARLLESLILYEDEGVIALNKPFGLAVQGGAKTTRHIDGMLAALEKGGDRPRLVHRLDRDTGGLLILAKTREAARVLGRAFQGRDVSKTYWALAAGAPARREGLIDLPVAKRMTRVGPTNQERMIPAKGDGAKTALTDFQIVDEAGTGISFLALRPRTGRTHQLRVHCAAIGAPIVGDPKYGGAAARLPGVASKLHLFCREMTFRHPLDGLVLTVRAPLTGHMRETWEFFGFDPHADAFWPENRA